MRIIKNIFKWIGLLIFALIIAIIVQVSSIEMTPEYSFINQTQFDEAIKQVDIWHHILMIIIFTTIALIMELYLCKWTGNKITFSEKITFKNIILSLIAGIISVGESIVITSPNSSRPGIISATLKTNLAIPLILVLIIIAPTLEEMLFQGAIQKGFFKKINPWISIILTAIVFDFFHNITINLYFLSNFISGILFGSVYQKTDDIKNGYLSSWG